MRNWILRDLCDDNLIEAIERNAIEHRLFLPARHPKMQVSMHHDLIVINTRIGSHDLNHACLISGNALNLDESIQKTLEYFKEQELPFSWIIGPTIPIQDVENKLEGVGFGKKETIYSMTLNLHHFKKKLRYIPGFRVQQALTKKTIQDVCKVYTDVYEHKEAFADYFEKISHLAFHLSDPIKLFVGYLNEEPAIVGELFLGAGIAGLRFVMSSQFLQQEKELTIDLAVKMLLQAQQLGYHWGMVKSSKEKHHYFLQMGFKKYCEFKRYY